MAETTGRIGTTWRDSEPWWPPVPEPPTGAPNVVLIVLDDVGFAQLGCYGSDVATPNIDALAGSGVKLANFHTTALCSPTRACLLTGRNHHRNAMGRVADLAVGFPGYWGTPPRENGFLSEILRASGYATYAVGKWHLTPEDETNMAASRATWPLGRGFDRWYGFHGGETHQFVPALFHDNHSIRPPAEVEDGYHLTEDLVDRAIEFVSDLRAVDASRPYFLYFATGACHSPHQAPSEWIERYRGAFDDGWDQLRDRVYARQLAGGLIPAGTGLSPKPSWVPAWSSLEAEDQRLASRFMECFAGFLSHTDHEIGRLLGFLAELSESDDTLVVLVSDNGASAEGGAQGSINDIRMQNLDFPTREEMLGRIDDIGGPDTHNNYPWGWTMAGNTPFKRWKREVHEGGVADPCIISWPARLGAVAGGVRHHYVHAVDVMPTVLDLIGLTVPEIIDHVPQSRIDGVSIARLLTPTGAAAPPVRTTQYFEMFGSRAIYHDGWKAVTFHPVGPIYGDGLDPNASFQDDRWELYHVAEDLSETRDLADAEPERLDRMVDRWWEEAAANDVLPLDNRVLWALVHPKPTKRGPLDSARYFQGGAQVPEQMAVNVRNRSHRLLVTLEPPVGADAQGVLLAQGLSLGGWSFQILAGRLRYVHNLYGKQRYVVEAPIPGTEMTVSAERHSAERHSAERHSAERHSAEMVFTKDDAGPGGVACLAWDGAPLAEGPIPVFTPSRFNGVGVGLTCGYEWGPAIGEGYRAPFRFNGRILEARVEATGPVHRDPLAELEAILAEQ
jgi:arylsulfatase A-like enzyme